MPSFSVSTINYAVYALDQVASFLDMADLVMPDIQHEVASIKGAGVAGTIDYPIQGHTADLVCTFNFHTPSRDAVKFLMQRGRQIEARAAVEVYDSGSGEIKPAARRMVMRTLPKGLTLGTLEVAAPTGTSAVVTVVALTIYIDDERVFEHDKFNLKYEVEGDDSMAEVRRILFG